MRTEVVAFDAIGYGDMQFEIAPQSGVVAKIEFRSWNHEWITHAEIRRADLMNIASAILRVVEGMQDELKRG